MEALHTATCPACGDTMSAANTVCWDCFKYRDNPFKYSELSLEEWLQEIKEGE